jgi:hypothetical protein
MHTDSVETDRPPEQARLVPPGMRRFHEWRRDGVDFEFWANAEAGCVLADVDGAYKLAGVVAICGEQLTIVWQGPITAKPPAWLNAQRAVAAQRYFGGGRD